MTAAINLNQLARMSAESMLNCMLEGIAIGLFAWILLQVVGRRNSSTRFAVWFSALLAIAALPVLGVASAGSAPAGRVSAAVTVPSSWALAIFVVWTLFAAIALVRVAVGLCQLRKLRASCTAIDPATLDPLLRATLQTFQSVRPVELCRSERLPVPTAIGFLKPLVVIPGWAMQELSPEQLNSILIHELAHLRRWDDWTNLAQQVLKALLFFHPAVWWIENRLALEREMACDDAVLAETADPRGYAQCLLSLAEKRFMRRGVALAQAVVNRMRQTSLRVSQILDANRSSATRVWKPALYSVAVFFVVCLVSLLHAPELVAFEDPVKDRATNPTPELAIASPTPVSGTLIPAIDSASLQKHVVATAMRFRAKSAGTIDPFGRATETLLQKHRTRQDTSSVAEQSANYANQQSTSSLVPQNPENHSGLQPLRRGVLEQVTFSAARFVRPAGPQQLDRAEVGNFAETNPIDLAPAILVVMQTQYDEAVPRFWRISIWRVTIMDSSRIAAETRIPAKQI